MERLKEFIDLIVGEFDNSIQYSNLAGSMPLARHINTVLNHKISGIPNEFNGVFILEESYYNLDGRDISSPHLFLFTAENDGILLNSYELPDGFDKSNFKYENIKSLDFESLKVSKKFVPALFKKQGGSYIGGSVSDFGHNVIFTLSERFSKEALEVREEIKVNGKRTFGFDFPIIYKRI